MNSKREKEINRAREREEGGYRGEEEEGGRRMESEREMDKDGRGRKSE